MLYQKVPKPENGKRWVVSDIHGCSKTFKYLIQSKLRISKDDQLFLLGDYINRGPNSTGVLNFILSLVRNGFNVFPLRGNHEQMLLDSHFEYKEYMQFKVPRLFKNRGLTDMMGRILPKYYKFMTNLPYYYELDNFYLVHAGFNFNADNPFEDYHSMLWKRKFQVNVDMVNDKKIVHGHMKTPLQKIVENIALDQMVIPLDNGCYEGLYEIYDPKMGNLLALDLDTMDLIIQPNLDRPY